jgi:hypothetical protein
VRQLPTATAGTDSKDNRSCLPSGSDVCPPDPPTKSATKPPDTKGLFGRVILRCAVGLEVEPPPKSDEVCKVIFSFGFSFLTDNWLRSPLEVLPFANLRMLSVDGCKGLGLGAETDDWATRVTGDKSVDDIVPFRNGVRLGFRGEGLISTGAPDD